MASMPHDKESSLKATWLPFASYKASAVSPVYTPPLVQTLATTASPPHRVTLHVEQVLLLPTAWPKGVHTQTSTDITCINSIILKNKRERQDIFKIAAFLRVFGGIVGILVGSIVGLGFCDGISEGVEVGMAEGSKLGIMEGICDGIGDGIEVGTGEGTDDGITDGRGVGSSVGDPVSKEHA